MSTVVSTRYIGAMSDSRQMLDRLGALIHQSVRDDAARHGLLPIHIQVLGYLARANNYSDMPIAIAEYFGLTRGTVSQTLAVLERKGLIERSRDKKHGRRIHLCLTLAGHSVLEDSWERHLSDAVDELPVESEAVNTVLRGMLLGLQRYNGQRAFGVCHRCTHFLRDAEGAHCQLTREPLAEEQTQRICREWTPRSREAA